MAKNVVPHGLSAPLKHRPVSQGPHQDNLHQEDPHLEDPHQEDPHQEDPHQEDPPSEESVLLAAVLRGVRLPVLPVQTKNQVARPIVKEIVGLALQDHPAHPKEKVRCLVLVVVKFHTGNGGGFGGCDEAPRLGLGAMVDTDGGQGEPPGATPNNFSKSLKDS